MEIERRSESPIIFRDHDNRRCNSTIEGPVNKQIGRKDNSHQHSVSQSCDHRKVDDIRKQPSPRHENDTRVVYFVCSDCNEKFNGYKRRCVKCGSVQVKFLCECGAFLSVSSIKIHDCESHIKRCELKEQFKMDRKTKKMRWKENTVL